MLFFADKFVLPCAMGCTSPENENQHYHCPFCDVIRLRRKKFLKHLTVCRKRHKHKSTLDTAIETEGVNNSFLEERKIRINTRKIFPHLPGWQVEPGCHGSDLIAGQCVVDNQNHPRTVEQSVGLQADASVCRDENSDSVTLQCSQQSEAGQIVTASDIKETQEAAAVAMESDMAEFVVTVLMDESSAADEQICIMQTGQEPEYSNLIELQDDVMSTDLDLVPSNDTMKLKDCTSKTLSAENNAVAMSKLDQYPQLVKQSQAQLRQLKANVDNYVSICIEKMYSPYKILNSLNPGNMVSINKL